MAYTDGCIQYNDRLSRCWIIINNNIMVDILHLYISAASDLDLERESLSRLVAEIPVTLGWRVIQSPIHGEMLNTNAITEADVHILLLGTDIRAPIGLEWRL